MGQYAARRFLYLLMVLLVLSVITFFIMHQIPGGPFTREKKLHPTVLQNLNHMYHLDDPLYQQYASYVVNVFIPRITTKPQKAFSVTDEYLINIKLPFGKNTAFRWMNFGPSYLSRTQSVNDIIRTHLPISAQLGVGAMLLLIGIVAFERKHRDL